MDRSKRVVSSGVFLALVLFLSGGVLVSPALSQDFQSTPILLRASAVLPKDLLSGPNYRIKEAVINDGLINIYDLDTHYGLLKVESTPLLLKRINELKGLQRMEALKKTDIYLNAFQQAATAPIKTAEGLITDPVGTASGIVSGIGRFFGGVKAAVTGGSSDQPSALNSLLGQASYKREYAYEFNVDPYSSYEPLQKELNDLSWTATAGGLTVKAAMMAIPGAVGTVVGMAGTAQSLKALVRDKMPAELTKVNTDLLSQMKVPDDVTQAFLANPFFDPWEQTLLVGELWNMANVKDRKIYMETAAAANEEPLAVFLRVRVQLMGHYYQKVGSVDRFADAGGVPLLVTTGGKAVVILPFDYVAWSLAFAQKEQAVSSAIQNMRGITGKELLVTGTVNPVARRALESLGWKVEDNFGQELLKIQ